MHIVTKFISAIILAIVLVGVLISIYSPDMPELNDGDLVFQTSITQQSAAIIIASQNKYSHVGVVAKTPTGPIVIEATYNGVTETPFKNWIKGGLLNRFAIYRYREIDEQKSEQLVSEARKYLNRGYDFYFSFDNKELYCSELAQLTYRGAGLDIGKIQGLKDLDTDNPIVINLIRQRWQGEPLCKQKGMNYETCLGLLRDKKLITPASLAADLNLELIYSNYLF